MFNYPKHYTTATVEVRHRGNQEVTSGKENHFGYLSVSQKLEFVPWHNTVASQVIIEGDRFGYDVLNVHGRDVLHAVLRGGRKRSKGLRQSFDERQESLPNGGFLSQKRE